MSYASIMVHVSPSEQAANRITLAATLAERFAATLIGIAARPANLVAFNDYGGLDDRVVKHELRIAECQIADARQLFGRATEGRDRTEWRATVGWTTPFMIEQARAADLLVVVNERDAALEDGQFGIDTGELLLQAGRPLLIVPAAAKALNAPRAVIAWKNTREARRALRDSLPLLRQAEVEVVGVAEAYDDPGLADVCSYLRRHQIAARPHLCEASDDDAWGRILHVARDHEAGLIIAGGYGHGRLSERLFGGVTRELLKNWSGSCLLAH